MSVYILIRFRATQHGCEPPLQRDPLEIVTSVAELDAQVTAFLSQVTKFGIYSAAYQMMLGALSPSRCWLQSKLPPLLARTLLGTEPFSGKGSCWLDTHKYFPLPALISNSKK
ncbi:hypothetical protein AVEN_253741-1 [Araneus ventricosus]|uniref:Uncharacterized protein n=1 Tax=Araneus ventricosus TaxID=182803 RepID=A0A4Y2DY00_ARAVE|nr:hypothetical protein AVEN_253741-1 [Araneus ventricosus]